MGEPAAALIDLPTDDTPVALAAEIYARLGFMPIPLYGIGPDGRCTCRSAACQPRSYGKHPIGAEWQRNATTDVDQVRDLFRNHRGNIGLLMGREHVAIDTDGPLGAASLLRLPTLPTTLTAQSGSGVGEHRIFRFAAHQDPEHVSNRPVLEKLDAKTRNGQIAVAPSRHASGGRYRWTTPAPVALLPDAVFDVLCRRRTEVAPASTTPRPVPLGGTTAGALYRRAVAYLATIPPAISGAGGHQQAFAAARALVGWLRRGLPESDALHLLREYNRRCEPPWSERELAHKWAEAQRAQSVPDIEDRPASRTGGARVAPIRPAASAGDSDGAPPATSDVTDGDGTEPPAPIHWRSRLIMETDRRGRQRIAKHAENAIVVVRYHPDWAGRIRLDTHASAITVHAAPWHDSDRPQALEDEGGRPWSDADDVRLSAWIKRELDVDLSIDACARAVAVAAEASTYHPVRDWMVTLVWDGVPRLSGAARRYLGAALAPHYDPLTWWLTAAVARTFEPGCKVDNVLILEGPQGLRKSSALRALASPPWFSDTPLDLQSKDAVVALQGRLVVELAELESLRKADAARAKSFFSSCVDDYRPHYGKRNIKAPRQCVFAGTVNPHGSYLQDPTGNRRYWPVTCTAIDLEALAADREQLWAEAVDRYFEGGRWWPETREEMAACEAAQDPRSDGDEWEVVIAEWLAIQPATGAYTVGDILSKVLGVPRERWTRSDQMRVGAALQRLGYSRKQVRSNGERDWRYTR